MLKVTLTWEKAELAWINPEFAYDPATDTDSLTRLTVVNTILAWLKAILAWLKAAFGFAVANLDKVIVPSVILFVPIRCVIYYPNAIAKDTAASAAVWFMYVVASGANLTVVTDPSGITNGLTTV